MTLVASILGWVLASTEMLAGLTIRYTRGAASAEVDGAISGRASDLADTRDPNSPRMEHSDRDFIVDPLKLVLDGQAIAPQTGDQIEILDEDHAAFGKIFEVYAIPGQKPYRSCDSGETRIRIFTHQVA